MRYSRSNGRGARAGTRSGLSDDEITITCDNAVRPYTVGTRFEDLPALVHLYKQRLKERQIESGRNLRLGVQDVVAHNLSLIQFQLLMRQIGQGIEDGRRRGKIMPVGSRKMISSALKRSDLGLAATRATQCRQLTELPLVWFVNVLRDALAAGRALAAEEVEARIRDALPETPTRVRLREAARLRQPWVDAAVTRVARRSAAAVGSPLPALSSRPHAAIPAAPVDRAAEDAVIVVNLITRLATLGDQRDAAAILTSVPEQQRFQLARALPRALDFLAGLHAAAGGGGGEARSVGDGDDGTIGATV